MKFCPQITSQDAGWALMTVASSGHVETIQNILQPYSDLTFENFLPAIAIAAENTHVKVLQSLLERYPNVAMVEQILVTEGTKAPSNQKIINVLEQYVKSTGYIIN